MRIIFMGARTLPCRASMRWSRRGMRSSRSIASRRARLVAGKATRTTPVQQRAEALGIPVRTPTTLKTAEEQGEFRALDADLAVVAAYGLILPKPILEAPEGRLHQRPRLAASALARSGADPARDPRRRRGHGRHHHANGRGPRYRADAAQARASDRTQECRASHGRTCANWARRHCSNGSIHPSHLSPQPETGATYAAKIDKAEARIDWARPADASRAPGAGLRSRPRRLVRSQTASGSSCSTRRCTEGSGQPGRVLDDGLRSLAAKGRSDPSLVQRAGRAQ